MAINIAKVAGGFNSAIGTVDKVIRSANGLLCIGSVLFSFTNPSNLLKGIGLFASNIASSVGNVIADAIQDRVDELLGTVSTPIALLQNYIKRITRLLDKLTTKSLNLRAYLMDTQNCSIQAANFMNCIIQSITNKLTKGVLKNINSEFDKLQNEVSKSVYDTNGLLAQHVGRNIKAAEKVASQLSIMY